MQLIFDQTSSKVEDLTLEVNEINNTFKDKTLELLSRFDFESSLSKDKCKHYPVSFFAKNAEEIGKALELISQACWATLHFKLLEVKASFPTLTKPMQWDEKPASESVKLGKIYMCSPNRFCTVNTEVTEPKVFAYGYQSEDRYEIQGEVNFGIEIY